jgi:hypothetical protein
MLDLGLNHPRGRLVDEAADLELGGAEELAVGLGGEEFGHLADFGLGRLESLLGEDLGAFLLLGGQVGRRHGAVRVDK